jgi:hypothetical protein
MPPHLGAARRNAASGTPQIPDHRQRARLATEMLPHGASLETVRQFPDALATEMLLHGASLETARQSPDALATEMLPRIASLETAPRQRARLATEMLPHAASLETVPSQQARGASPSAMRPRLAPATLRERRHPVRQLFVAVEMVKG